MAITRHFMLVVLAVVLEAIILLSWLVPFSLPRGEAWQAAALLCFFASFL
jgi:hypothetical protein